MTAVAIQMAQRIAGLSEVVMDIVERLLNMSHAYYYHEHQAMRKEAADEIERLREDIADLKELMQSTVNYTGISVSTEKYAFHAQKALGEKE